MIAAVAWRSTLPQAPGFDLAASVESYPRQWDTVPGLVKVAEDLRRYETVLAVTGPEVVVECGTWTGRSAAWFADLGVDVVTVDVNPPSPDHARGRVTWLPGNSASAAVAAEVRARVAGRRAMVVLDSDHSPRHVLAEMALYGGLVADGCYMVVEDGICRFVPDTPATEAGPLDAIETFLAANRGWVRDLDVEGMFPVTHHPCGWLRRQP